MQEQSLFSAAQSFGDRKGLASSVPPGSFIMCTMYAQTVAPAALRRVEQPHPRGVERERDWWARH